MPLTEQLCAIYFDALLDDYDNALTGEIKQSQPDTYESNAFEERNLDNRIWRRADVNKKSTNISRQECVGELPNDAER